MKKMGAIFAVILSLVVVVGVATQFDSNSSNNNPSTKFVEQLPPVNPSPIISQQLPPVNYNFVSTNLDA